MSYCHNDREHREQAREDARFRSRDDEMYERWSDDPCKEAYTREYDRACQRIEERRQEERQAEEEAERQYIKHQEEMLVEEAEYERQQECQSLPPNESQT